MNLIKTILALVVLIGIPIGFVGIALTVMWGTILDNSMQREEEKKKEA